MKKILFLLILCAVNLQAAPEKWESSYTSLLGKYVSPQGVRYADWKANTKDLQALNDITQKMASTDPTSLTKTEQLAFYINAYNAWTINNVLAAYPIKSIRDVYPLFGFFSRKTIIISGEKMSLNNLEKAIIIAKFKEPRIHAAINCASQSCPPLASESYTAAKLDKQLDAGFSRFVNQNSLGVDAAKDGKSASISSIFKWYAADFEPKGGPVAYINQFRKSKLADDAKITYQDYDWNLNEAR